MAGSRMIFVISTLADGQGKKLLILACSIWYRYFVKPNYGWLSDFRTEYLYLSEWLIERSTKIGKDLPITLVPR